jgi:hypothetical protein
MSIASSFTFIMVSPGALTFITAKAYGEHFSPIEVITPTWPPPLLVPVPIMIELPVLGVEFGAFLEMTIIGTQIRALVKWGHVILAVADLWLQIALWMITGGIVNARQTTVSFEQSRHVLLLVP